MEISIAIRLEEQDMVQQMQKATINSNFWSLDSTFGHVYHVAYPFIPKVCLGRSEELIQNTKKEIETEAKALFSRSVTDAEGSGGSESGSRRRAVRAINPYYSFVNRSCEPNAGYSTSMDLPCKDGSQKCLYAIKNIKKGEEITIAYLPFEKESKEERQLTLRPWIGAYGHCGCRECLKES